jgi:hypothetical protein
VDNKKKLNSTMFEDITLFIEKFEISCYRLLKQRTDPTYKANPTTFPIIASVSKIKTSKTNLQNPKTRFKSTLFFAFAKIYIDLVHIVAKKN